MNPSGPLRKEHRLIEKLLTLIHQETLFIKQQKRVNPVFIDTAVDFIKMYADRTHHGKEEQILFSTLEDRDLRKEDRLMMEELIRDHVYVRELTDQIFEYKTRYVKGNHELLMPIVEKMDNLVKFYPGHVWKEENSFFHASLTYLSEQEQQEMLEQFYDYDKNMIHIKYTQVITRLKETSQMYMGNYL